MMSIHRVVGSVLLLVPLGACIVVAEDGEDDVGESSSDSGSSSETGSTGETGSGETGSGETGSGSTGETGSGETGSTDETGTPGETGSGSTGETDTGPDTGGEGLCATWCGVLADCNLGDAACVGDCETELAELMQSAPECFAAQVGLLECASGLDCGAIQLLFEEGIGGVCQEASDVEAEACGGCGFGTAFGGNPGECLFDYECGGEPHFQVECDGTVCTCLEDGVSVGSCDAVPLCMAIEGNPGFTAVNECCGWTL